MNNTHLSLLIQDTTKRNLTKCELSVYSRQGNFQMMPSLSSDSPTSRISNNKLGYLYKKSKWLEKWSMRWVVLKDQWLLTYTVSIIFMIQYICNLILYGPYGVCQNEKELVETGRMKINVDCVVQTMPDEGNDYRYIFTVYSNSDRTNQMIFCTKDCASIESWMMCIIQATLGTFE